MAIEDQLQSSEEKLTEACSALERIRLERDGLKAKNASLKAENAALKAENAALKAHNTKYYSDFADLQVVALLYEQLKEEYKRQASEIFTLRGEVFTVESSLVSISCLAVSPVVSAACERGGVAAL